MTEIIPEMHLEDWWEQQKAEAFADGYLTGKEGKYDASACPYSSDDPSDELLAHIWLKGFQDGYHETQGKIK